MTPPVGRTLEFAPSPGPGALVTVDGLDGTGKTTLIEALRAQLSDRGVPVVTTRLPTGELRESRFFQLLQRQGRVDLIDPLAFEIEYMVDRIQHCRSFIEPAMADGKLVITDRYAFSSIGTLLLRLPALRDVALRAALSEAWFADLCRHLVRPDLAFVLRVDGAVGAQRLRARAGEVDVNFSAREYDALQNVMLSLARANDMVEIHSTHGVDATLSSCLPHLESLRDRAEVRR